ncbi:MAG: restriction endonuclease subunit S [Ruminococcus bicirculans (ex Wegman et al. 2014)]|uniref:restriction endonuclease subunit S n=1 Tax=Ruminococcus bicirculans (ex Wegman et al. 2014) TaxID=1160721 RepID=UPI00399A9689
MPYAYCEQIGKEIRDISDEIPFEIPESWEWTSIGNIAFVTKLAGFEYTKNIAPNLQSSGVPLFKGKNVQNGNLIYNFENYISESLSNELIRSQINKKCLLTPYVGTIGNIAIFPGDFKAHLGSNVGKIEIIKSLVLEEYVMYFFRSDAGYKELTKYKKATAQESISIEAIRNAFIPIPPLAEQHRIVAKIEQLIPYIEKYEKAETQLTALNKSFPDMLKKSILQEAVQGKLVPQNPDDEPASVLLERIRAEKQVLIKAGKIRKDKHESAIITRDKIPYEIIDGKERCIADEVPFELPESWCWCRLGTIFQHNTGKALNSSNHQGTMMQYITTSNLYWDRFELDKLKEMLFTDSEVEKCTVTKGDLLVCEGGDIGRAAIWNYDYPMRIQNHIHRLRSYAPVEVYFFYYVFYLYKRAGLIGGKGIGIQGLSSNAIDKLLIPLPPLAEQKKIVAKIEELMQYCDKL